MGIELHSWEVGAKYIYNIGIIFQITFDLIVYFSVDHGIP